MFIVAEHNNKKTISTKKRNANPAIDKTKPKIEEGFYKQHRHVQGPSTSPCISPTIRAIGQIS